MFRATAGGDTGKDLGQRLTDKMQKKDSNEGKR